MSVNAEAPQGRIHGHRLRLVPPLRWRLWELPRPVLAYVLLVDVAALAVIATSTAFAEVTSADLVRFLILACAAVIHLEAVRGIERLREVAVESGPYVNLKSLWVFASVIVLPLSLVMALTAISYLYCWLRVYGHTMVFRKAFSAATFVLASGASAAVLDTAGFVRPGIPAGPLGALALVAAAAVWWLVNFALVVGAIVLSNPAAPARRALGDLADQLVVAAALGLGIGLAALLVFAPWLVAVLMVTVLALHQGLLMPQLQRAAQTDGKTGLMEATYWSRMAGAELARARQHDQPVAMLVLDLDHFRQVNNEHGHVAGDQVLRAAAAALRAELRHSDLVGRFGGDELVVLLPGATAADVHDIAARILDHLRALVVVVPTATGSVEITGLTASLGAALSPDHGTQADQLILAADQALLRAKRAGRDRLCVAS